MVRGSCIRARIERHQALGFISSFGKRLINTIIIAVPLPYQSCHKRMSSSPIDPALDSKAAAKAALAAAEARFIANNPLSKKQHDLAVCSLPGGNTRTLLHTSPFPLCMKQGKGAYVWDEDGHKYLDLTGELSAGLYGHSHPVIRSTILSTFDNVGVSLGATTAQEQRYAALLCDRFKLDRVRMTNTGTEANLHALAAARHYTGCRQVVVFAGGYHGAVLSFPSRREPLPNLVDKPDFIVLDSYNDSELAAVQIEDRSGKIAAVLVEGMQGAGGCIPASRHFLHAVQDAAHRAGALFILDEVMTSRLAPHGLGASLGLKPDLVTMGKYLGGGFAFGALGGRANVMAVYDPRVEGSLAHSGTFNNNTMAMHAGYTGLSEIFTPEVCVEFNAKGDELRKELAELAEGSRLSVTGLGTLMTLHFTEDGNKEILDVGDVKRKERGDFRDLFWFEMLEEGFWITRRGYIAMILDTPDEDIGIFLNAVKGFLKRHEGIMRVV
ncbi:pyridoxal phosphate-dependent transferase [Apodospora peruviana]|uniref:Pyridoxal phosphate-dependent transferase n=1 Tax=Apodospora peruviana TaxID=516989 RepID=A0AAE0HWQ4_9PEZI|nr:pyridoxal phosphate-dependent transferase [Apodospora peruviana]